MKKEIFKAESADEIVWLRLNRLRSVQLCEKIIRNKLVESPNAEITEEIIQSKAIGISSAIESALGYWQVTPQALNAKILSRYYFLLQMTIAEQVGSVKNIDGLKEIQKHTEKGHGLGLVTDPYGKFPDDCYVFLLGSGHFNSYAKFCGVETEKFALDKKPKQVTEIKDFTKVASLTDLFRRIPELNSVIEEYLEKHSMALHIGHAEKNMVENIEKQKQSFDRTGNWFTKVEPKPGEEQITHVALYSSHPPGIYLEYLKSLTLPFFDFECPTQDELDKHSVTAKFKHPAGEQWFKHLETYSSSYATNTYAVPLWTKDYDSVITNFALLYSLSIIVRYMPDLWYRITNGDLNHIGSMIEYYISIMDHVIPLQMLERISETNISINNPGSIFGQV